METEPATTTIITTTARTIMVIGSCEDSVTVKVTEGLVAPAYVASPDHVALTLYVPAVVGVQLYE